jgi:hypothetical protein
MGSSKNTFNTTLKRMGRLDKMVVFNILITVITSVCDSVVTLWRESARLIFLEGGFGLTPIVCTT